MNMVSRTSALHEAVRTERNACPHLAVANGSQDTLIAAARDQAPVTGLTHNFYRYPARFSPRFVRAAIEV